MNRRWWRWSKQLRRRSVVLGLAGIAILAAAGLLTFLIVDTVILY